MVSQHVGLKFLDLIDKSKLALNMLIQVVQISSCLLITGYWNVAVPYHYMFQQKKVDLKAAPETG